MGCSASVVAVDLARDLLRVHRNSTAVVISTENITQNWYQSNDKVRYRDSPSLGHTQMRETERLTETERESDGATDEYVRAFCLYASVWVHIEHMVRLALPSLFLKLFPSLRLRWLCADGL
jgi:hypothetical protein